MFIKSCLLQIKIELMIKFILTDKINNSNDINIIIACLRFKNKPKTPIKNNNVEKANKRNIYLLFKW